MWCGGVEEAEIKTSEHPNCGLSHPGKTWDRKGSAQGEPATRRSGDGETCSAPVQEQGWGMPDFTQAARGLSGEMLVQAGPQEPLYL